MARRDVMRPRTAVFLAIGLLGAVVATAAPDRKQAFVAAAYRTGRPAVPAGWSPKVGDEVLMSWRTAEFDQVVVKRIVGGKYVLSYADERGVVDEPEPLSSLVPVPARTAVERPRPGQYAIARIQGTGWEIVRVDRVVKATVHVARWSGARKTVGPGDLVLFR